MDPLGVASGNYPNAHLALGPSRASSSTAHRVGVGDVRDLIFCTLAGYGLAQYRFPGDRILLLVILSTLMLPSR